MSHDRPVIAVVKADAYGHGAVDVSRRLAEEDVEYLAVAFTEEARELRDAGINSQILVLFDPDIKDIFKYNLIPVISDKKTAAAISKEAERSGREISIHIKVDTGMGRLGIIDSPAEEIADIASLKNIKIDGMMSHFSDADLADASSARRQIESFRRTGDELSGKGIKIKLLHIANSAAVVTLPESHFDAVRPGLMLYGYSPVESGSPSASSLLPVIAVKARIIALRRLRAGSPVSYGGTFVTKRDSLIGVMSAGYADGFDRRFSNNAEVLVNGKRVPVAGRVCMDLTMVDLTDAGGVSEGDDVIIIGKQGGESIDASELALRAGTIPYEILTSLGGGAKRVSV